MEEDQSQRPGPEEIFDGLAGQILILGVVVGSLCQHLKSKDPDAAQKIYEETARVIGDLPNPIIGSAKLLMEFLEVALTKRDGNG